MSLGTTVTISKRAAYRETVRDRLPNEVLDLFSSLDLPNFSLQRFKARLGHLVHVSSDNSRARAYPVFTEYTPVVVWFQQ